MSNNISNDQSSITLDQSTNSNPIPGVVDNNSDPQQTIIQGEIKMADIVTGTVTGSVDTSSLQQDHADIRRESAVYAGDIRREVSQAACDVNKNVSFEGQENVIATKDAEFGVSNRITNSADRVSDRMMELRGLVGQRFHEVSHDLATVKQGQATLAKDVELNALRTQMEVAKQTTYLADKVANENEKTRDLINDLKYHDLNRGLVERNTALVECEADRRHWRYSAEQNQFQGQWAALQSQIQAFASQLQETRQGMVNFGTMSGVGQTSTSNNVQ